MSENTETPENASAAACVWNRCKDEIRGRIKPLSFKTWFEPLIPTSFESSLLTLEAPSTYFYEWLEEHYFDLIQSVLHAVAGKDTRLQYAVRIPEANSSQHIETMDTDLISGLEHAKRNPAITAYRSQTLDPRFTFENFIRGDGNQFARAAALNVARHPGETAFNPLVLYGGVGLGKTHLIQAIGNRILSTSPEKRVCYVSSEKFTIDFVESIEKNRTMVFTNFYRNVDVLIVDDIQFFSGKERTQDTFFHTFNALHLLKKQIILSSDRPPKELSGLDERLTSRFLCGLTVDIQPPDLETRIAILMKKAEDDHISLPQDVVEYIASNVKSNIRELEGCYIGLIARHTLDHKPIDIGLAETVLKNVVVAEHRDITVGQIQKLVADHFKVAENSLRAKTRRQEIVLPRQIAMYLSKAFTRASLKTIGLHFGGRDHSTIIHACKTIENIIGEDESIRSHVEQLARQISFIST